MNSRADASRGAAPPSIVLADNDRLILEAIGELLRSKGYEVQVAEDGLAAWHLIRQTRPTYIVLDVVMPKLDGSQVCWLVRRDPVLRNTPIVAFSSLGAQDFRHFPNLSADAYVAKGDLATACRHLLQALAHLQATGRTDLAGGIFGYDGTQPRALVAEMLQELRRYASLVRALGPGTIELDADGRILRVSAGACEILGRTETTVVGELVTTLCPARDRETLRQLLHELTGAAQPERCRAVVRFGDRAIPIQVCALVDEGRCMGFLLILETAGAPVAATGERQRERAEPAARRIRGTGARGSAQA